LAGGEKSVGKRIVRNLVMSVSSLSRATGMGRLGKRGRH
jgi:hypothetical protein